MICYRIRDWHKHFERSQARKVERARWVPLPVKHDGLGYRRLIGMPGGVELYGAWVLIVQVAAKCPVRGMLADESGPYSPEDLEFKTGCPARVFESALKALTSEGIKWIESFDYQTPTSELVATGQDSTGQNKTGQDKTISPSDDGCPPELREWIDWWNCLRSENLVPCGAESDPPAKALLKAWNLSKGESELKKPLASREALAGVIRRSQEFLSDAGWFTLTKLLHGKNRTGEWIVVKLLDGGYLDRGFRRLASGGPVLTERERKSQQAGQSWLERHGANASD